MRQAQDHNHLQPEQKKKKKKWLEINKTNGQQIGQQRSFCVYSKHTSAHCKYNLNASSGDGTDDKASIV